MGEHRRNRVTREARKAFAVAADGIAAGGENVAWMINALRDKHPGTATGDIIVCIDEPGSDNHRTAMRAGHGTIGVPFVHARLRARSGCLEVQTTPPPDGRMWLQVGLSSGDGVVYEVAAAVPIVVDGLAHGLVFSADDFDRGAAHFAQKPTT